MTRKQEDQPRSRGDKEFRFIRPNVPHRNPTPEPAHLKPVGRRTLPSTFTSYRTGGTVHCWGSVQLAFLAVVEADPRVRWIRARPEGLPWFDGKAWRTHVCDFEVGFAHGVAWIDVVGGDAGGPPSDPDAIRGAVEARGARYRIVTAGEAKREPRLANSLLVSRSSRRTLPVADQNLVTLAAERLGPTTVEQIACASGLPFREGFAAILALAWKGSLEVDMGLPLGPTTMVRRAAG